MCKTRFVRCLLCYTGVLYFELVCCTFSSNQSVNIVVVACMHVSLIIYCLLCMCFEFSLLVYFFSYIFDNSCKTSDQQGLVVMVLVVVLFPSSLLFLLLFSFLLLSFLLFFSSSSSPLSSSLLLFLDFWFTSSLCYCYFVIITLLSYQCILKYSRPSIIRTSLVTADSSGVRIIKIVRINETI